MWCFYSFAINLSGREHMERRHVSTSLRNNGTSTATQEWIADLLSTVSRMQICEKPGIWEEERSDTSGFLFVGIVIVLLLGFKPKNEFLKVWGMQLHQFFLQWSNPSIYHLKPVEMDGPGFFTLMMLTSLKMKIREDKKWGCDRYWLSVSLASLFSPHWPPGQKEPKE